MNCYYAWNTDGEIVRQSSSGGIFTALACRTLRAGGRVCGAAMDPGTRQVMHVFAEDEASLKPLRGAKYPQSAMGGCYGEIAETLRSGRPVLFTGTPCQTAALLRFLEIKKTETDLLLTAEVLCHGVTNTEIVNAYIGSLQKKERKTLREMTFRSKNRPWYQGSCMHRIYTDGTEKTVDHLIDPFYIAYVNSLILRPSCHACRFARKEGRAADLTIGDYWGAEEEIRDKDRLRQGVGLVLTNTEKGEIAWQELLGENAVVSHPLEFARAVKRNGALVKPARKNPGRERFFAAWREADFIRLVQNVCSRKARISRLEYLAGYDTVRAVKNLKKRLGGR